eukprot:m.470144 g.470144  ORF g.470144 m.470144 type:complete len:63 (-) comp29457_c0_seq1:194-382(-)
MQPNGTNCDKHAKMGRKKQQGMVTGWGWREEGIARVVVSSIAEGVLNSVQANCLCIELCEAN